MSDPQVAPPVDQVEALAKVLGDARIAEARQAEWWTSDEDHALLVRVLRAEVEPWAAGVLAAGYSSPTAVRERADTAFLVGCRHGRSAELTEAADALDDVDPDDVREWLRERANPFKGGAS